ncbi:MAG: hypothetical protein O9277_07935 [Magnetospirillum sp.]|nr:hypothetical protein [Magnetospirillum sp.]
MTVEIDGLRDVPTLVEPGLPLFFRTARAATVETPSLRLCDSRKRKGE